MYTNLGYIVYRTILDYYSGDNEEDAYGKKNPLVIEKPQIHYHNLHFIYRHAEGLFPRQRKEINDPPKASGTIRGGVLIDNPMTKRIE